MRLADFRTKEISDWLQTTCRSWYAMDDLRNIISGIFTKAVEWEILPDTYLNPMRRVKLPSKWTVRERRILTEDETVSVLARLEDPHLLINLHLRRYPDFRSARAPDSASESGGGHAPD